MSLKFWLSFFAFAFICLFLAFLAGFSLKQFLDIPLERSLLKKSVKLQGFLYLERLNKKLNVLIKEGERIQSAKEIKAGSPFFAWAALAPSVKRKRVYMDEDQIPSSLINLQPIDSSFEGQAVPSKKGLTPLERKTKQALIRLSQINSFPDGAQGFQFQAIGERQPLIFFALAYGEGKRRWTAFLKEDRGFFKLPRLEDKTNKSQEAFVLDSEGRIFFHSKNSGIFKRLPKKSPIRKSLKELSQKPSLRGGFLQTDQAKGSGKIYYLQKWGKGNLFLIVRLDFSPSFLRLPFLSSKGSYWMGWGLGGAVFLVFFLLFALKLSSLASAYKFLKLAVMSFGKIGLFPPVDSVKNPLLYFYSNRRSFLNNRAGEDQAGQKAPSESLNFQDIVRQEAESLKNKYPRLNIKEEFDFDVRVFGFEKFARLIVREMALNAVEAMGGLKEPEMELSLKEEKENLAFSVRDYGAGAVDKNYKKLFRVYYSTKSQPGVGLTVIQSIVQANGGSVEISSPKGGGLKVCVRLPLKCFLKNHLHP